jgi:hypothetical protein
MGPVSQMGGQLRALVALIKYNSHSTLRNRSYKIRNTRNLCFYSISYEELNIDRKIFQVQAKTDIEKTLQNFCDNPKLDLQRTV